MKSFPSDFGSGYYIVATNAGVDRPNIASTTEDVIYSNSPIM